jgi:hypothetical protein
MGALISPLSNTMEEKTEKQENGKAHSNSKSTIGSL